MMCSSSSAKAAASATSPSSPSSAAAAAATPKKPLILLLASFAAAAALLPTAAAAGKRELSTPVLLRDTAKFKPCLVDGDCSNGKRCFMYFCYAWNAPDRDRPFKVCRRQTDCRLDVSHGASPDAKCYRHHDRRRVRDGVCVDGAHAHCASHADCPASRGAGGRCCNGYCCNQAYFDGIRKLPCKTDEGCRDLEFGDRCCVDIMGSIDFRSSRANWSKVCCSNKKGPFVHPPRNVTGQQIRKLEQQITRMDTSGLKKKSFCNSLDYDFMLKFGQCTEFTTTTTTTTTAKPMAGGRGGTGTTSAAPAVRAASAAVAILASAAAALAA